MPDNAINDRDELDLLLDAALASDATPDPSPNLVSRILAATTQRRRGKLLTGWVIWAVPAFAALLAVVILIERHEPRNRTNSPITSQLSATPHVPQPAPRRLTVRPSVAEVETTRGTANINLRRTLNTTRASTPPKPLPKQEVFPTPTPLSPQEQAVAALVNSNSRDSKELAQQITQPTPQGQPTEPLRIAAIHIPPLNPPDNGGNN